MDGLESRFSGLPIRFLGAGLSDYDRAVHIILNEGDTDHIYVLSREEARKLVCELARLGIDAV